MMQIRMMILDQRYNSQLFSNKALHMHDQIWRNEVRSKWFQDGDRDIKFFHNTFKLWYVSDKIARLRHDNNFSHEGIQLDNHIINFYKILFTPQNNYSYIGLVEITIPQRITHMDNEYLTRMTHPQDIMITVYNMNDNSRP